MENKIERPEMESKKRERIRKLALEYVERCEVRRGQWISKRDFIKLKNLNPKDAEEFKQEVERIYMALLDALGKLTNCLDEIKFLGQIENIPEDFLITIVTKDLVRHEMEKIYQREKKR